MKRYVETFFRYWLIIVVPILVLPAAEFALIRKTPHTVVVSQNIWVNPSVAGPSANYNQWETPAQNEQAIFDQLLQTSGFDLAVVQASPLYQRLLSTVPAYQRTNQVVADLVKNLVPTVEGNWSNLLSVSYTSTDWRLGTQVINGFIAAARSRTQSLSQEQTAQSEQYYAIQLHGAQQAEQQSSRALSDYILKNAIPSSAINDRQQVDPTLASLMLQDQQNRQQVTQLQEQISKLKTQEESLASTAQSSFQVLDAPSVVSVSSKKQMIMGVAIALVIGLLLGGGFLVVRTALDRSVRSAEEVPVLLALPVLAVVPYSPELSRRRIGSAAQDMKALGGRRLAGRRKVG